MKITWSTILYNEEQTIERALLSILPIIDKVVVGIDNKTTDRTESIIKDVCKRNKIPVKFIPFRFNNNYSEARNKVLEHVETDWVLVLDGDEYLHSESIPYMIRLKHNLSSKDLPEEYKEVKNMDCIMSTMHGTSVDTMQMSSAPCVRLFKKHVRYRFRIHEEVDIETPYNAFSPFIRIINNKTSEQRATKKTDFRVEQLKKDLEDYPGTAQIMFNLGMELAYAKQMKEAGIWLHKALENNLAYSMDYMARLTIGVLLFRVGKYDESYDWLGKLISKYPERAEHIVQIGAIHYMKKEYFEALSYFFTASNMSKPKTNQMGHEHFYTWLPWYMIWRVSKAMGWEEGLEKTKKKIEAHFPEVLYKLEEKDDVKT